MLIGLWQGLGKGLAERWITRVLTPAFAFWAGGAVAWAWNHLRGDISRRGWVAAFAPTTTALSHLPGVVQAGLAIAALLGVVVSAEVADRLTLPVLRLLEGYGWPGLVAGPLRKRAQALRSSARDIAADRLQQGNESSDPKLERTLREIPAVEALVMPTRLGNLLRAAEARPREVFGLDSVACWSHLWLVLDKDTRKEMAAVRTALDSGVRLCFWGALFTVWTVWAWWALPIAVVVAASAYYGSLLAAARTYGDLLAAAFTLNRFALYAALRWPSPPTPDAELKTGNEVNTYLWRGLAPETLSFQAPSVGTPQP